MTIPSSSERDALLAAFNKAMFARDMDALNQVVAPDFVWRLPIGSTAPIGREVSGSAAISAYLDERKRLYQGLRYSNAVNYHAAEASFISFHLVGRKRASDAPIEVNGLDRFLFRDGKIVQKDSYWKRIEVE